MGLFGDDGEGFDAARAAIERNRKLYDQIALPEYKEYVPELYNTDSYKYNLIDSDPLVQSRQEQLLSELSGLKDTGLSDVDAAEFAKARDMGNQMSKANTAAAIQDAQNRGVGGSGLEFALREMAGQGGAQRAQEAGLQTAADAARQRAMYLQAYGSELGNQRAANYQQNAANTNIINQFNQANTQQRNQTANANVDARNNAFMYNQGLVDKNYQNQLGKADRIAGFNNQQSDIALAEDAQKRKKNAAVGSLVGAGAGAMIGGPAGAAVGSQIGGSLG